MDTTSAEKRARLRAVKLAALVRDHRGADLSAGTAPAPFPGGSALVVDEEAWVLVEEQPARGLGGALAWAVRQGATALHLLAESSTGLLARRAAEFRLPISVWHVEGRTLLPAVPEPLPQPAPVPDGLGALVDLIVDGGAEPIVEHGVLSGEVDGLEVCRAVADPVTGSPRLEVGVGAHDREAFMLLHGDRPRVEALHDVVLAVRPHRQPGAAPHPLNRLAGERALRHRALSDPGAVGASELHVAPPPVPRANVKDPVPCVATGTATDGRPLVAVFSSGVDLDVVPFAADARSAVHPVAAGAQPADVDLVIVVPERDRLPVTEMLAALLVRPARVTGWPAP